MPLFEKWVAPATLGNGNGDSPANALGVNTAAGRTTALGWLKAMQDALVANPAERGLNVPHKHTSVTPGYESAPYQSRKAYVEVQYATVTAGRLNWVADAGPYTLALSAEAVWMTLDMSGVAGKGTAADPHRFIDWCDAYRRSDGKRASDTPGGTTTRSDTYKIKDPAANKTAASNYTGGFWTGPTVTTTKVYSVDNPSPVRIVLQGSRTKDPRPNRNDYVWNAGGSTRIYADVNATNREPRARNADGSDVLIPAGSYIKISDRTITTVAWGSPGEYAFRIGGSCLRAWGIEARDVIAPFTFAATSPCRWLSFRDVSTQNTKYGIWRSSDSGPHHDVEFIRVAARSNAQKWAAPGKKESRWYFRDVFFDGEWVIGDPIQTLFSVDYTKESGPIRVYKYIAERCWDGRKTTDDYYLQGDAIDFEGRGLSVRHLWSRKTGDGGIDGKVNRYHVGWPAVTVTDANIDLAKRGLRYWRPGIEPLQKQGWLFTDVRVTNARNYALFLVSSFGGHITAHWDNPDGRPHYDGTTPVGTSNDGTINGDMEVFLIGAFDARITQTGRTTETQPQTSLGSWRNPPAAPWHFAVYPQITPPTPIAMTVDGTARESGERVQVASGTAVKVALSNVPTGAVIRGVVDGGPCGISVSGTTVTFTPTTA